MPFEKKKIVVYFLKDFIDMGWLHYATFNKCGTGGWAQKDGLYCVYNIYKKNLKKESFLGSYLVHEAQHFSDLKKYPKLIQADAEYRAKLAEIITVNKPNKFIHHFLNSQFNNKNIPHSYAEFKLIGNLSEKIFQQELVIDNAMWEKISPEEIKKYAKILLQEHSFLLNKKEAKKVTSVLN